MQNFSTPAFFIVGTGRCGTNMLRKMLLLNPELYIVRETHWLPVLFHYFGSRKVSSKEIYEYIEKIYMAKGIPAIHRILKRNNFDTETFKETFCSKFTEYISVVDFMNVFYSWLAKVNKAKICADKTPDYGISMEMLYNMWPQTKFIHIHRDGRDVALSMSKVLSFRYQVLWRVNQWSTIGYHQIYRQKEPIVNNDIAIELFYYLWENRKLRMQDESNRIPKTQYMEVSYEDIVSKPLDQLIKICKFLDWNERKKWVKKACETVEDNLFKNQDKEQYKFLTKKYY